MTTPQPPARPGHAVLDEARAFIARFAAFPSAAALDSVTLWCAHSHALDAFSASPRLAVMSDGPASGKTRVLELAAMLSHAGTIETDITAPALISMIAQRHPTILMDETDLIFGEHGGSSHKSLRSILNSGYRRGATVSRRSGASLVQEDIFAAIGFGGLGVLPSTLMSRCITVRMRPRRPEQQIEPYFQRTHGPVGAALGEALAAWVASVGLDLAAAWPEVPETVTDRSAEIWEPLLAVADAAGGSWPERARRACLEMVRGGGGEPVKSPAEMLLDDLRTVWRVSDGNLPSAVLINRLYDLPAARWRAMWPPSAAPREMAALLAPLGVRPVKIRVGDKTCQGYRLADLQALWPPVLALPAVPSDRPEQPETLTELGEEAGSGVPDLTEAPSVPLRPAATRARTRNTVKTAAKGA